ncbi:hypothetical protein P7K49_005164 [Saguinus oedipus]|uniref:Uncharacterized protein n=1 Tax=Saguinus oedipus TaxID=9490 RepID=A0ABQ9W9G5_SAGOE|nr:hypothetical protein P7K49_005164 [Saguinus oedipus]
MQLSPPRAQLHSATSPPAGLPAVLQTKRALSGRQRPRSGDRRVAAMLARGGGERVTEEEYRPANKERVPAPRPRPAPPGSPPRPGRHRARCGRRPKSNAPAGPARAALTCVPGQAVAPLGPPQPAPPHGPARPKLAPREPYLLAANAAVHRPAVSAVAHSRSRRPQPEPQGASRPPLPRRV